MQLYNGRRGRIVGRWHGRRALEQSWSRPAPRSRRTTLSSPFRGPWGRESATSARGCGAHRPEARGPHRRIAEPHLADRARPRHTVRCDAVGDRDGLGLPVGDLFTDTEAALGTTASSTPVQPGRTRTAITLAGGVRWERLTCARSWWTSSTSSIPWAPSRARPTRCLSTAARSTAT